MSDLGHRMILASAGTGKTYTLVNRFLKLLSHGVSADKVIALTFTRKAAGEFLQKIFLRLTEAAADDESARKLSVEIDLEDKPAAFFKELLVALVARIGDLQLGTIDSFFARVVGAFPYELGLTRPHRIMDDFEKNMARQLSMERLMAAGDENRTREILQLYKQLTWGAEEKSVYRLFEDNLLDYHSLFLESREPLLWGATEKIFRQSPWWAGKTQELSDAVEKARNALPAQSWSSSNVEKFRALLDTLEYWQPGIPIKRGVVFDRLLESHEDLKAGHAEIKVGRTVLEIDPPLSGYLLELMETYMRLEIGRRLVMTRSLGTLLAQFDQLYETSVRETGSLVFADFPMLLIKGFCDNDKSFLAEDITYRLDGQADHWLVDEFQDTSRIQWKVLSTFVDEVLQDPSGQRTFFYVGDIKQSIYGWRGGDSRLFGEIFKRYGDPVSGIRKSTLHRSWRSAPPVLNCVNRLFGASVVGRCGEREAADRWMEEWQDHESSPATKDLPGHAAWGLMHDESGFADGCIDLINTIQPLRRGLSCAVLVRKNKQVLEVTQGLREAGIPASMEGVVHIAMDNIVGTWMRALFYFAARPDEAFPKAFLQVAGFSFSEKEVRRFAGRIRHALTEDGFAEAVRIIIARLHQEMELSPMLKRRSEQLLEAATRFEGTGIESVEAFLQYLKTATVEESSLARQVQVMTVHKAKGLDFDMVIVAGFGPDTLIQSGNSGLHVERRADGEIDWILDLPNKHIVDQDPVLRQAEQAEEARNHFEAFCLLYVAMTRARQGLYILADRPKRRSSSLTWHQLLEMAFGTESQTEWDRISWQYMEGDSKWYENTDKSPDEKGDPVRLKKIGDFAPSMRPALRRAASPSSESHEEVAIPTTLRSGAGKAFGSIVHDFLARYEWLDFENAAALEEFISDAPPEIRDRLSAFVGTEEARQVFLKPQESCLAWREKPYLLRRADTVANGIIDRATVYLGEDGRPRRVKIFDFKTDALDPERPAEEQLLEKYTLQLERYQEAVGVITGLPPEAISASLIPV